MGFLRLVKNRRSVRKFTSSPPAKKDIRKLLEAARWAPSGLNNQPWRFMVIENRDRIAALAEHTKYRSVIKSATAVIVVCMDLSDSYNREKDLMAIGACIEHILLQATEMGIGSCWLGEILNRKKDVSNLLGLDKDLDLMAVVALGLSLDKSPRTERKGLKDLMIG